jgi:hypothetical protein
MKNLKKAGLAVALVAALAVMGGCGGSDDTPAATSQVPDSASASAGGFIAYLKLLVASAADTLEPVDVSAVTPPKDDTSEPDPTI